MLLPLVLYREESESDEELEWRLLRAGDLDRGLEGDRNIKQSVIYLIMQNFKLLWQSLLKFLPRGVKLCEVVISFQLFDNGGHGGKSGLAGGTEW